MPSTKNYAAQEAYYTVDVVSIEKYLLHVHVSITENLDMRHEMKA